MLETPEETKVPATAGPQCPGNARLAKGTVTCLSLSVSADQFRLQASPSIGHVSTARRLRASCHEPPARNADTEHNNLHPTANDQSACLRT